MQSVSIKDCPEWMDIGTRGCPIKEGVVLAGSFRKKATCFVIMELGCSGTPFEFRLPYAYNVHSIGMVYDEESELLTVAGGVYYDREKNISNSIAEVWQIKLYEKGSKWYSLPDLPYDVFDPVLISFHGNLYVLGGYDDAALRTEPANAIPSCVQLLMEGGDGTWSKMGSTVSLESPGLLQKPLDHHFGGRGVLLADNIILFGRDYVQIYNISNNSWKVKDLKKDNILECTPVIDHKDRIIVSKRYKVGTKDGKEQDIAQYTSSPKTRGYKWEPKLNCGVYPNVNFDIEHGAGRFLSLILAVREKFELV